MLQAISHFYAGHKAIATALTVLVFVWFAAKGFKSVRLRLSRDSLLISLVDLLLAPVAITALFALTARLLAGDTGPFNSEWLQTIFNLILCLVVSWYTARLIRSFLARRYFTDSRSLPGHVPGLLGMATYTVCLLLGAGVFFLVQGYSLTGVWISTGLATALLGFALQQTLGDFFSGIALSLESSFRMGDWLQLSNGTVGRVIDINWRATWLRDWDNSTHIIPNARLASQGFKNMHSEHHWYRPWYFVKIPAEVDPRFAKELLIEAIYNCRHILKSPVPIVRLTDASTLPYTYMVWVHFANFPAMFRGREELFREIHYVLQRAGVTPAAEIHEWRVRRAQVPTAEPSTIQHVLKSLDIFANLADEEIERISLASRQIHYDAGSTILLEENSRDALDIITSGVVKYHVKLSNGEKRLGGEMEAGQYYGLISMFTDHFSLSEYTADTDVTLIRIDIDCMREILQQHPHLADYYASLIKQRLDEVEFIQRGYDDIAAKPTTLQEIKRFIKQIIAGEKS